MAHAMEFFFSQPDERSRTYTVESLNREVRELLEDRYDRVWVEAEVVDVTRARSGHVYFTLADPGGKAQLDAVMWKGQAMRYGSRIAVGVGVRCHGRVTLYEVRGSYQLVVDRIEEAGEGVKARILAELKARLAAEGLFDPDRKRPLPPFPLCVGVVTSRSGAAFRDIVKVAGRRFPVRIVLAHAQVQGESAPREIAEALDRLAALEEIDVVIVGRGGGSSEDLDAFNAEQVVRAVARHPRPVLSAVGHEIDVTLVDLVSDRRAATPSEAAEMAVPDGRALAESLAQGTDELVSAMGRRLSEARERLAARTARLASRDPRVRLRRGVEVLARSRAALIRWPALTLARARAELAALSEPVARWPGPVMALSRGELARLASSLEALSPLGALSRGYAVVRRLPEGEVVRDAAAAPPGTEVDVTLHRGSLRCAVTKTALDPS